MRIRQSSISSSASYFGEGKCSLTVAVLIGAARSEISVYKGVSNIYIADIKGWPQTTCLNWTLAKRSLQVFEPVLQDARRQ